MTRSILETATIIALVTSFVVAEARSAHAGIVNVQSALATEAEEGLSGAVTGAVDWRTGNRTRLLFSLAPVARYRTGKHLLIGLASADYFRDSDDLKIFEHLRYRYQLSERWIGEVFGQHEFNEKRLLLLRALVGFGPRYQIADCGPWQAGAGVAYMAEYEVLDEKEELGPIPEQESPLFNHRLSSYLTASYALDDRVQLAQTVYAQPRIDDFADFRLLSESVLVFKVSKRVSFKSSLSLSYDSRTPEYGDLEALDSVLQSALTVQF
jgi:hypothetical protein